MSTQAWDCVLQKIKHSDALVSPIKINLLGWVEECQSETPLHALRELRDLIKEGFRDDGLQESRQAFALWMQETGLVRVLIALMQQNPHDFARLFDGYLRRMNFEYHIHDGIVARIAQKAGIFGVDERIQVECRWILCKLVAGMDF